VEVDSSLMVPVDHAVVGGCYYHALRQCRHSGRAGLPFGRRRMSAGGVCSTEPRIIITQTKVLAPY
jgi:hypothetical protein